METKLFSYRLFDKTTDGTPCSPIYKTWHYHGNILFKKGFLNRWWTITEACVHIVGFRFTAHIGQKTALYFYLENIDKKNYMKWYYWIPFIGLFSFKKVRKKYMNYKISLVALAFYVLYHNAYIGLITGWVIIWLIFSQG